MKLLRVILLCVAALIVLVLGAVAWVLTSETGAQWALARVQGALGEKLAVRATNGTLSGPLILRGVRYHDPETGVFFDAEYISINVVLSQLLRQRAQITQLLARGIRLDMREPTRPKPEREPSPTLEPPLDILIDGVRIEDALVKSKGEPVLEVRRAHVAGSWTDSGILIRQLEVFSPQGEIHLRANVDKQEVFIGDADGRFTWKADDRAYVGTLRVTSKPQQSVVTVNLSAPVGAQLAATLKQQDNVPWTMRLNVPRFPAKQLLADTQLKYLGAEISGSGDLESGRLTGNVLVNEERIELTQLQFSRTPEQIAVQSLQAQIRDGAARAELVGTYSLKEQLVRIERLALVELAGQLTANGEVRLAPQLAWQASAFARDFNPGSFAKEWPGLLNFSIDTQGQVTDAGPSGRFKLSELRGQLRKRRISGDGDLELRPGMQLSGSLQVRSGRSSVRVKGARGKQLDAVAWLNVASLEDWLPDSSGSIEGQVHVRGKWPRIAVEGRISATGISVETATVKRADVIANVTDLERRTGNVTLDAREVTIGDGNWSQLLLRANGDPDGHTLNVDAKGEPVSGHLLVSGALQGEDWSGTLAELNFYVARAGQFALRDPVPLHFGGGAAGIGNACLRGGEMNVCVAGELAPDGSMQAQYTIENLPLRFLEGLADLDAPLRAEGIIEGGGDIRREADGRLFGNASITSASGSLAPREEEEEDEERVDLLSYTDLALKADLAGDTATVTLGAKLNDGGEISGRLQVEQLGTEAPTLQGNARVMLASLAPIELFAPQVADARGRLEADASVAGTVKEPQLEARARVIDFGTQFPELGIELTDGGLEVARKADGTLTLEGRVSSGEGYLMASGGQQSTDLLEIAVRGQNFVVANIPAAQVRITPALEIQRTPDRMLISGKVTVPSAHVDVQKLPKRKAQAAGVSPDVVVIDDPPEEARGGGVPLVTEITVILGPDVTLQGFGLNAQLAGQLLVREQGSGAPTGSGEVRVSGTYKAYGQDLTIERGSLLFSGTPLDNPTLDLVAYRQVEDIRAGLRIAGTAQAPQLTVTSEPVLPEAEALSYLVTGRSLNDASSAEGDLVQSAARSLGTAAGNLVARSIGKRFGVDQLGIETNEALGGSVFTVGEYLSPRLFLSYGVGLFTPGDVVTLRYKLAEAVNVEASTTPVETRTSIHFRAER